MYKTLHVMIYPKLNSNTHAQRDTLSKLLFPCNVPLINTTSMCIIVPELSLSTEKSISTVALKVSPQGQVSIEVLRMSVD